MPTLYYVHDPMCSWCYAFTPTWERIRAALPATLEPQYVLGGLAPETDAPMPAPMREHLQRTWRRIQAVVPGTEFNFDFWSRNMPRRSTYPACRAVLTAKHLDATQEEPMIAAIQLAYYRQARNPSDVEVLCELGAALGLDARAFEARLQSPECRLELDEDIRKARDLGVTGFPSLVLGTSNGIVPIPLHPSDPAATLGALARWLEV